MSGRLFLTSNGICIFPTTDTDRMLDQLIGAYIGYEVENEQLNRFERLEKAFKAAHDEAMAWEGKYKNLEFEVRREVEKRVALRLQKRDEGGKGFDTDPEIPF